MNNNSKNEILSAIKGKLIVSCQALEGEPLHIEDGSIMHLMARAAKLGGAAAIRTNGSFDVRLIKQETSLPVIGIIKRSYPGFKQYITVTMKEVDELVEAGADIVAFDSTLRPRPDGLSQQDYIAQIKAKYPQLLLMADISIEEEAIAAGQAGVDLISTTLSGYTPYSRQLEGPDYLLVENLSKQLSIPIIAEGRVHSPEQARRMLELGAYAVVVGGAITRPLEITQRFAEAVASFENEKAVV